MNKVSGIYQPVATGSVTQANMKISAVNGTAFIDFTAADVLTGKLGNLLVVKDSLGNKIQGFIKEAGTGETYLDIIGGTNPALKNGDFESAEPPGTTWATKDSGVTVESGFATWTNTVNNSNLMQDSGNVGSLYKTSFTIASISGTAPYFQVRVGSGASGTQRNSVATHEQYLTCITNGYLGFRNLGTSFNGTISASIFQKVLAPSTSGCTIVSTKGGTTYNWAQKSSSFNYNDASGYTYEIYKVLDAPVVASGNISAGNALLDTTTANAFAAPVGVDLSPYQDGNHILALYQATKTAYAWISDTAPGGETLGSKLDPNNTAISDTGTEADATTDWNTSGTPETIESTAAGTPDTGTYHFHVVESAAAYSGFMRGNAVSERTSGTLYKMSYAHKVISGQLLVQIAGTGLAAQGVHTVAGYTDSALYYTGSGVALNVYFRSNAVASEFYIDNVQVTAVTDCATTGALLLSTKGGARGWTYNNGIDPNAAFSYKVFYVGA